MKQHVKTNLNKAGIAILTLDEADFRERKLSGIKRDVLRRALQKQKQQDPYIERAANGVTTWLSL